MSANDRLERDLVAWFAETAAPRTPEYTPDISLRAARVRQRPRWTFLERWLPMGVTTLGRQGIRQVPWRTVALLAALLLLLLLAAVLYVGGQRHVPAPFGPAVNGRIAFVLTPPGYENRSGYHEPFGDIVTVDPSTGVTAELVSGPEVDGVPAFSLDGTRLSFVRQVPGGMLLFAIDAAGGVPIQLTEDPLPGIREPAWSPDGRSVAFTVPTAGRSDLWIAATDGSGADKVELDVSAVAPQWRPPEGRELLFVGSAAPGLDELGAYHGMMGYEGATGLGLYRVKPDGTGLRPITATNGTRFDYGRTSWTPDGERIVTQAKDSESTLMRVLVLDADGQEVGRATLDDTTYVDQFAPVVSPDGTQIAYAGIGAGDSWHVHVRPFDGAGTDVTTDHEFRGPAASMHWSPDGKTIIVNHHFFSGTWFIEADDGATRQASWTDPGYTAWQRLAP